jgi:hypothetical protein
LEKSDSCVNRSVPHLYLHPCHSTVQRLYRHSCSCY